MQLTTITANGIGLIFPIDFDLRASRTRSNGEAHMTLHITTPSNGQRVSVIHFVEEPAISNKTNPRNWGIFSQKMEFVDKSSSQSSSSSAPAAAATVLTYVDTHCHLDEVITRLKAGTYEELKRRHIENNSRPGAFAVPGAGRPIYELCVAQFCDPAAFSPSLRVYPDLLEHPDVFGMVESHRFLGSLYRILFLYLFQLHLGFIHIMLSTTTTRLKNVCLKQPLIPNVSHGANAASIFTTSKVPEMFKFVFSRDKSSWH